MVGVDHGQIPPAGLLCRSEEMNNDHFRSRHCERADPRTKATKQINAHTHLQIPTASTHKRRFEKRTDDNNNSKDTNLHDMTSGSLQFLYFFF